MIKISKRDREYHRKHGVLSVRQRYRFRPEDKLMVAIFGSPEETYWMRVHSALMREFRRLQDPKAFRRAEARFRRMIRRTASTRP